MSRWIAFGLALLAAGWLAVSFENARLLTRAEGTLNRAELTRPEIDRALDDLQRADRLSPADSERDILEAALYIRQGRLERARRTMEAVARREPEVPGVWATLARLSHRTHPRRAAEARARLRALDPVAAGVQQPRAVDGR